MDNKTYLHQLFPIHDEINFKQNLMQTLKAQSTDTSAKPLDTEFIRTNKVNNANAIIIENIVDLELEISSLIEKYDFVSSEIKDVISKLQNDNERRVLTYRYIYLFPFKKISTLFFLSESQIFRIHRSALKNIER